MMHGIAHASGSIQAEILQARECAKQWLRNTDESPHKPMPKQTTTVFFCFRTCAAHPTKICRTMCSQSAFKMQTNRQDRSKQLPPWKICMFPGLWPQHLKSKWRLDRQVLALTMTMTNNSLPAQAHRTGEGVKRHYVQILGSKHVT